jgi:hypothetical protein
MKFIFWSGIIFFIGMILLMPSALRHITIEKEGKLVTMRIVRLPSSCLGTKVKHYATFSYNDTSYIKMIPAGYCKEHHVGEFVQMKYLEDDSTILFPHESEVKEMVYLIILGIFGLSAAVYSWFKMKK